MSQCKAYIQLLERQCVKPSDPSFSCCSINHGMEYKEARGWFDDMIDGTLTLDSFYVGMGMKTWSVGKYLHYLALNK